MESTKKKPKLFLYETNQYVHSVECEYISYNSYDDTATYKIKVNYRDGQTSSWESNLVSEYGNGLWVDSNGRFLYGCSLRGVYCCDLKTGKRIWRRRNMAKRIIMNADDTLTCQWLKKLFIMDAEGNVIKEMKTNYESSIFYVDDGKFLIQKVKTAWDIVSAELDKHYMILQNVFLAGLDIRSAFFSNDTLAVVYWDKNGADSEQGEKQIIDLIPYRVKE